MRWRGVVAHLLLHQAHLVGWPSKLPAAHTAATGHAWRGLSQPHAAAAAAAWLLPPRSRVLGASAGTGTAQPVRAAGGLQPPHLTWTHLVLVLLAASGGHTRAPAAGLELPGLLLVVALLPGSAARGADALC